MLSSRRALVSTVTRRHATVARGLASAATSAASSETPLYYDPKLVERRPNERGKGGRCGDAGIKVCLFGASGFLGRYVGAELGANGFMTYFGNRGDDMEMRDHKTQFDLGRTRFVFYSPRDRDSIKEVIADADVVVNMIGKFHETGQPIQTDKFPYVGWKWNYTYEDANIEIPRMLAEICLEMQVDHLVHVSSANASPTAKSRWARTKYEGELAIKEVYPWACIIRPTQLFGKQDRLLNWFGKAGQSWHRVPLIYTGGREALTQPVWVGDVAKVIRSVCDDPDAFDGRQIDCFGPADFTYAELAKFVNDITQRNYPIHEVPIQVYRYLAKVMNLSIKDPMITPDLVDMWSEDFLPRMSPDEYAKQPNDSNKILTMKDLGIEATSIEKDAFRYLQMYRFGGHFQYVKGYHIDEKINAD